MSLMALCVCAQQNRSYTVQVPRQTIDLNWMLRHPMGFLPFYNIPKTSVIAMGTTPDSKDQLLWEEFKVNDDESVHAQLQRTISYYPYNVSNIEVSCTFSKSGNYIKKWTYELEFTSTSAAHKYATDIRSKAKALGYHKEGDGFFNKPNMESLPSDIYIRQIDDLMVLDFWWARLIE